MCLKKKFPDAKTDKNTSRKYKYKKKKNKFEEKLLSNILI